MENPYASQSQTGMPSATSGFLVNLLIALVPIGVIIANYATASAIPRELWDIFSHVVFLIAPISLLIHLPNLIASLRGKMESTNRWWFLALLLIPTSFVVSISSYFSNNPYEEFVVMNRFFGPFGWMLWTWLIVLGILPLLELIPAIRRSRWIMMLLSLTAIVFQVNNAYWVWQFCHLEV